jgi:peptidyl-prolyl cis-trans isomerase C
MTKFFSAQWTRASAVAVIALMIAACGKGAQQAAAPPPSDKTAAPPPVAIVDGTPISRDAYDDYLKGLLRGKPASDVTAEEKNQVLDQMINMQLIATQAEKDGMEKDPDVATRIALLRTQILADAAAQKYVKGNEPSDQDLHAAYDAATDKTEYHASHILVATKEKAVALIKKIKGGAKFEDVAKAESTDNSKANGGDLGWFTTARMVKPFGDAVKGLKKGETTPDPVQTQYGWHIIRLDDTRDAPFDQLKPQLSNALIQKKFQAYIDDLKKNAKIEKKLDTAATAHP